MRPHVLATTALLTLSLAGSALAQDAMRFRGMDQNGDGRITRQEWRGSDQSFDVHDWNGDGILSGEEVRAGARRRIDDIDFDRATGDFYDWTEQRFARLDRNGDGRIVASEWPYDTESFLRVDRNRDRVLSRAEFLGDNVDEDRNDRFDYLDTNNNGRLERAEWHGSANAFNWLDRNDDGVLSRAEVVGEQAAVPRSDLFARLDTDGDNRIAQDEWLWSRLSFVRRDLNRDGVLSRTELTTRDDVVGTTGTMMERTISVDSTERWTDTGMTVRPGESIEISARGSVRMSTNTRDLASPAGSRMGRRASEAPLPQHPAGALIGRIGESAPFFLGSNNAIVAPSSGRLYLGVNDDHLADNEGAFDVTVRIGER
jgi:hypothetical protein